MFYLLSSFFLVSLLTLSSFALDYRIITPRESLRDGDTLVSPDGTLRLGFFSPGLRSEPNHRFLALWCTIKESNMSVWIANRETPLLDSSGVLNLSSRGDLRLINGEGKVLWTAEASRPGKNPVLKFLPSGNLVSIDADEALLWQSFDHPVDTLLAGMKLGKSFEPQKEWSLTSWKSPEDPSIGDFSLAIETRGFPQLVMKKKGKADYFYRLGSWNGLAFTGTPQITQANNLFHYDFTLSEEEVTYSWTPSAPLFSRLVLSNSGFLERFVNALPNPIYKAPLDQCDYYAVCGAYATCTVNATTVKCSCFPGFKPKSPREWSSSKWASGCVREVEPECGKSEGFVVYPGLKVPDTSRSWYDARMTLDECKERCSRNCSCTAYANTYVTEGGRGCLLWFSDLMDIREYPEFGQDVYIRMGIVNNTDKEHRSMTRGKATGIIIGSVLAVTAVLVGFVVYSIRRKSKTPEMRGYGRKECWGDEDDMDLPIFEESVVCRATDDFSETNFLGKGGFGSVYKGKLEEGQEIAVKRLSEKSVQGIKEFKNEVKLIAKLQHRNLVRLLGCCIYGDERMLIYEYLPNKSLDQFIFDENRRKLLDWHKRMNIIGGIARGLLYLHQDSRLRIIHRDLKAGNVLLDNDMNPKISDFGLAKSFGEDQVEASTNRVVGTYGYMSPEYAVDGHFSIKSDVFSFGVLVLEIVTGRRNRGFHHAGHDLNLLGHVWKLWLEDRTLEIIKEALSEESCVVREALRCVHVGLLCVQQNPEERPNMASVVLMLSGDGTLPQPNQPGFFTERNIPQVSSSTSLPSTNEVSITMLHGR